MKATDSDVAQHVLKTQNRKCCHQEVTFFIFTQCAVLSHLEKFSFCHCRAPSASKYWLEVLLISYSGCSDVRCPAVCLELICLCQTKCVPLRCKYSKSTFMSVQQILWPSSHVLTNHSPKLWFTLNKLVHTGLALCVNLCLWFVSLRTNCKWMQRFFPGLLLMIRLGETNHER